MINVHPTGATITRLCWAAWILFIAEMTIGLMSNRIFVGTAIIALGLTITASTRYLGVQIKEWIERHARLADESRDRLGDRIEAATHQHAKTMGQQVLSANELVTLKWRAEALAKLDAAATYSSNDTGPFQIINGYGA
ncbi:hypothetical protein HS041_12000 [Planomonospora sp. ID67723]|uniref:hypothetical protein n=1 Tax=Planomonospora sp. ID67723 TaxID=2738134 RepID=UPI0018C356C7|nr:hypothetical protein [Planomonospora sp. ID67723]MBG0828490.1 hypothetical protein [Planomonospora sp. ID67723]